MALALIGAGQYSAAEAALRDLLATGLTTRGDSDIPYLLAWSVLGQGRYGEGFQLWEQSRFSSGTSPTNRPVLSMPEWRGEPVQSLLLLPDQGLGDQIQFIRFAHRLGGRCTDVHVAARRELAELFAASGLRLAARGASYDAWAFIGSLPALIGAGENDISAKPYIKAPRNQGNIPARPARIGIAWRGDPKHPNDSRRSLREADAKRLLRQAGATSLHPEDTGARSFAETAAIIERMELVISVDTSIAHLAGAMGKPTWLLVPQLFSDWRWLQNRSDSPWYPSVRIFRQEIDQDWGPTIDVVLKNLSGS